MKAARALEWISAWMIVVALASTCKGSSEGQNAYPQPPATQALATLMAQGVPISDRTEYPAPIPGPLAAPSTIEASPHNPPTQASTPDAQPPLPALAARFYLAGRLLLEVPQVQVIDWESGLWITPNLGCQVSTNFDSRNPIAGFRIFLKANGQEYEVHSDQSGEQLCLVKPLGAGERIPLVGDKNPERIVETARLHLASRLGLPLEGIILSKSETVRWQSSNLGCPSRLEEQPNATPVSEISGYQIILTYLNTGYAYHSGGDWLVYCGVIR